MKNIQRYIRNEDAITNTTEIVLLTLGFIVIAGILVTAVVSFMQNSAEKSSCANSNDVFCTE